MRRAGLLVLLLLAGGCSLRFSSKLNECAADADCTKLGAELVCDTSANVCVDKACTASSDCEALGAAFVCDATSHTCAQHACTSHDDCAAFGDNYACRAGTCTNACFSAAYGASGGRTVKMGAIFALSADDKGSENAAVRVRRWSVELALQEINGEHGGIQVGSLDARKVDFAFCDSEANPALAGRLAKYLTDQGRVALLTGGTDETLQVLSVTRPKNTVVVSVSATANKLTVANGQSVDNGHLFFRTVPRDEFQGQAIYQELRRRAGESAQIGVVYENNLYGTGLASVLLQNWTSGRVVDVPFSAEDPKTVALDDLDSASPMFTVIAAKAANAAEIIKAFQTKDRLSDGKTTPLLTDSATNQTVLDLLGERASVMKGALGTIIWLDQDLAAFQAYKTAYGLLRRSAKGGGGFTSFEKDGTLGPQSYDGTYLLAYATASALQRAGAAAEALTGGQLSQSFMYLNDPTGKLTYVGSTDFGPALSELANGRPINLAGTSGSLDFDDNGDVPGAYGLCRFDGSPVTFDLSHCTLLGTP